MNISNPFPSAAADDPGRLVIARLQRTDIFRTYQQAFENLFGLPLTLRSAGSFKFPLQGSKLANPFCVLMSQANKTCSACLQLQQRVEQEAAFAAKTIECFTGLSESAVPINVGSKVIGYLQTGQVLLKPPTPARFRVVVNQLTEWGTSFDLPHLKLAYFGTRVMAKPQYDSIINLLNIFSQHLAALSNRVMIEQTAAEAPVIIRARAYISEHHGEAMRMRVVAQAVHTSTFYFCKVFKRATGLTYTEYVSRVRIESVKRQLLDRHLRVSEAAYAAGFQSLSQFNRVFRRIEGESPSHYRDQLHTPLAISAHFAPRAA